MLQISLYTELRLNFFFGFKKYCEWVFSSDSFDGHCVWCPQHPVVQHQPGEQADIGLQRLVHDGGELHGALWGHGGGKRGSQAGGGQRAGDGPVQLLFLSLHAVPCLTLHHDDSHQLVQVGCLLVQENG